MGARDELILLLESYTGIEVARGGIDASLDSFLARRLREARARNLEEYLARLSPQSAELQLLLDSITVTHSWFMRDPGQLAVITELLRRRSAADAPLKVWVPGCATGEDVYSIAILAEQAERRVEVLGTDINSAALQRAERGVYGSWSVKDLSEVERYFARGERSSFHIAERFKRAVRFTRHNLLDPAPSPDWDVILCRNVLIYIARERARAMVERLADSLVVGGHLMLGASEVVFEVPPLLEATYIASRLVLRRLPEARAPSASPLARSSLVPPGPKRRWQAPLPAVPRLAAQIAERQAVRAASPLSAEALLARGHELLDRSELAAAVIEYELAVEVDATRAEPHMYLGIAHYLEGRLEPALHELRAAAFLDAELWPASFYLAVCHEALGQLKEATREYQHVLRVAARATVASVPRRHSAWHRDLLELARRRASSTA